MNEFVKRIIQGKQNFAEKQKAKGEGLSTSTPQAPLGTGSPNRHGMPQLPVGQRIVKNWPVLDLGMHPEIPLSDWQLEVTGLVENPLKLNWEAFMALPQTEDESDFHCVTTWSRMDNHWIGVRFQDLMELALPQANARYVLTEGYDYDPVYGVPYTTNLSLEAALDPDVLLVHHWEGQPLPPEHGGPCRMITPRLYAWKGAKWIRKITLLADDQPGFWEKRGYSNTAHPWENDRYSR
jgi:DMSO/TMAO reductase YedYZ molybdopterin-dependent catalytic subunit